MKYKVWIEIEAVDDDSDFYETASPFPVCLGEFPSLEKADPAEMMGAGMPGMSEPQTSDASEQPPIPRFYSA